MKPASNFTKQRWVELLRDHYGGDWGHFIIDFVPPPGTNSWDGLLHAESATKLRPGGNGIAAVRRFTGAVAEHYYAMVERVLREADPDALLFGDRLPIYYDPVAVRAMARHVDVIAMNYNIDSPDGWVARYFFDGLRQLTGGKPVLISEWFFAANENRSGNRNNGHLMTVATQAERARGAAAAAINLAAVPEIVGTHWFQLAYNGEFPLGEAYRLAIGLDAGAGPRRFTLYFVPPRTKTKDHPPMAALLCAREAATPSACTKVDGAASVYFGADQPRITAEGF